MQRTDGQPKRPPMRQARPVESLSDDWLVQHLAAQRLRFEQFCRQERQARRARLAERLRDDPDVELYRLEKELAVTRWTIQALRFEVPPSVPRSGDHQQTRKEA
jgi:hypothetical protein